MWTPPPARAARSRRPDGTLPFRFLHSFIRAEWIWNPPPPALRSGGSPPRGPPGRPRACGARSGPFAADLPDAAGGRALRGSEGRNHSAASRPDPTPAGRSREVGPTRTGRRDPTPRWIGRSGLPRSTLEGMERDVGRGADARGGGRQAECPFARARTRVRNQMTRIRRERALLEAYERDGWRGAAKEKLKPVEVSRSRPGSGLGSTSRGVGPRRRSLCC